MIVPKIDLTGHTYGRLTVLRQAEDIVYNNQHYTAWWCSCSCGNPNEILARGKDLRGGSKKSCGCLTTERLKKYNSYDLSGEYGKGWTEKGEEFWFDLEDYDKIKNFCWWTRSGYFVAKRGTNDTILLSRLVMNVVDIQDRSVLVDHKKGNKYDNRKENLRIATSSQNSMNSCLANNNTSGNTGVFRCKNLWGALITVNNKRIPLGYYQNYNDALQSRKNAEEKYFGEWSYDNSRK